ncbi:hypothetical protein GQ55_3G126000 [Panicum hallii var. hallii]|uniref:Uncharacterized protein n=1 Tax=Panicum hallii var. hallii TaxID=1504633 RepID=A0A2T7E8R5_9POAL|nr:hypothetical protein GQ55_3G126000 [Panicum hallii var. hallii]
MAHAAVAADSSAVDADDNSFRLLSVSWNQDSSCFTAATTADFRVFNCAPFQESLRRVLPSGGGGYAIVEMLFRSSVFALVAAGEAGRHRVELWDDKKNKRICDITGIRSAVRAVRVSMAYLAVVLDRTVRVYELGDLARPLWKIPTALNLRGLCCLSCHADSSGSGGVLACPGTASGQVRVEDLGKEQAATRLIAAHSSEVACMAMTTDGAVLATASVKGTLVRVFSTMDGTCLQEVRRGADQADIHSIALSPNLRWLAVCSDKGTLHVFSLRVRDAGGNQSAAAGSVVQTNTASNARSSLSFMKGILPNYFSSEWSFVQFRLPETTRYVAAFGEQNTVMIIGMDGSFYRCGFDPVNGKEMVQKECFRFLKDKDSPPIRTLSKKKLELHDV